ncbi:MAG: methionine--tRNA ligase, partial [Oscillospiraceae bacterium]|nr:methionine--tRNA ligase [Oscillospiraceae bacterium]
ETAAATAAVLDLAVRCNKYIDETAPWVLARDGAQRARLNEVLYNLLESIRLIGVMLSPLLPGTAEAIAGQLGTDCTAETFGEMERYETGEPKALFARIEAKK